MTRAYLAGPDVFLPSATAFAAKKKELCHRYGFEGVFPLDVELDLQNLSPRDAGLCISQANEKLIRSCQLVIAHMTPFRGPSCDVGTAYEMGFARALGLRVFAYSNVTKDFSARTKDFAPGWQKRDEKTIEDADHMQIESFDLTDNLMLVGAVEESGGNLALHDAAPAELYTDLTAFEECLEAARKLFGAP